jgi:hypothetical protein
MGRREQGMLDGGSMTSAAFAGSLFEQADQRAAQQQRDANHRPISREVVNEQAERTGAKRAQYGADAGRPGSLRRYRIFRIHCADHPSKV